MNAEIKQKWIDALRSGKYTQATQVLRDVSLPGPAHCCLGVLCDLIKPTWDGEGYYLDDDEDPSYSMPPGSVLEIAKLREDDAETLASMNDNGRTFADIADHIEREL